MSEQNKKFAIIGVSSLLLVAMIVAVTVGVNKNKGEESGSHGGGGSASPGPQISTSTKAIKAMCQPTDYKQTCEDSLNSAHPNTSDPKELVRIGFQAAMEEIKKVVAKSETLKEVDKDPMASQALANCRELMDLAIQDLQNSFTSMGEFDLRRTDEYLDNLKTWLSGSITYQQTCLDGFVNTTSDAGQKMKEIMVTSQQLTSNGLAMVTQLTSILKNLNIPDLGSFAPSGGAERRLLEADGLPSWASAGQRMLLATPTAEIKPNVVVAKDGSGKYNSINQALNEVPKKGGPTPFVIHIKAGVYTEQVTITKSMKNVVFIGDGPTKTKITGRLNFIDGTNTYKTATVAITGESFMAKDIGFENSAGAAKHQAVAVRASGDMAIFYNVRFDGYQDTLYAHAHRQFYRDCVVTGTIDFIFGDASALFQNCLILIRKPLPNQACIVTAQGRTERREVTGIVLQNCTISGEPDYKAVKDKNKGYLGRPWKEFSRTMIMQSQIEDVIAPEGWLPWNATFALDTLWYAEYKNRGPGANTAQRVQWKGLQKTVDQATVEGFTAAKFIAGDVWIPATGVPYTAGMIPGV